MNVPNDNQAWGLFFTYKGRGFIVGLVTGACLLLFDWLIGVGFHDSKFYSEHGWPKLAAFVTAAVIVWWMDSGRREERLPGATGDNPRHVLFSSRDSLLLIPVKYWPGMLIGLGILFYFVRD